MKASPMHVRALHGLAGIRDGWRRERSFRSHAAASMLVLLALVGLRPEAIWWALAILGLAAGLGLELLNGAVEALADHLHPARHPQVRIVKDMASGGVLIVNAAMLAIGVALLLR
jgi:diacylglycerol kinase (ATP)